VRYNTKGTPYHYVVVGRLSSEVLQYSSSFQCGTSKYQFPLPELRNITSKLAPFRLLRLAGLKTADRYTGSLKLTAMDFLPCRLDDSPCAIILYFPVCFGLLNLYWSDRFFNHPNWFSTLSLRYVTTQNKDHGQKLRKQDWDLLNTKVQSGHWMRLYMAIGKLSLTGGLRARCNRGSRYRSEANPAAVSKPLSSACTATPTLGINNQLK